ncbi:MAG: tyrosine--tRNA ligase [Ezakiella sp.]|nr:tyrosine--tRNA ligase [Ezakiella sp.]MDD7472120.1 tyrosine--tRNA ligase [Bacillota bacterium]MDY3923721.1 tyrosine--tRNA ligase [Ezakiella sp.]
MTLVEELKARGFIEQMTYEDELTDKLNNSKMTFYAGFDCTADSLTVGHYLLICLFKHLQNAGHKAICMIGGGTTMIGDPSGRTDMRRLMSREFIDNNAKHFEIQLSSLLNMDGAHGIFMNNKDWLLDLNFLDFVREIGTQFSVKRMLQFDCYKNRLDQGLTFFEFSYMLMQSYDYLQLYRKHHCTLQVGGNDQWSNMLGGYELVKQMEGETVYNMTIPLLTTADGVKMGKSMGNAIWLSKEKTSPFDLYQYFRNVDDRDVIRFMKLLTFLPLNEIARIEKEEEINRQKEILAYEITKDIHGKNEADKAIKTARALFSGQINAENMPEFVLEDMEGDEIGLLALLVKAGLCNSNSEARNLITGGGISIDNKKINDPKIRISKSELEKEIIIQKGKKVFLKVRI